MSSPRTKSSFDSAYPSIAFRAVVNQFPCNKSFANGSLVLHRSIQTCRLESGDQCSWGSGRHPLGKDPTSWLSPQSPYIIKNRQSCLVARLAKDFTSSSDRRPPACVIVLSEGSDIRSNRIARSKSKVDGTPERLSTWASSKWSQNLRCVTAASVKANRPPARR